MVIWEAKGDVDGVWLQFAMEFSRLQSIAVQVSLAALFSPHLVSNLVTLGGLYQVCRRDRPRAIPK